MTGGETRRHCRRAGGMVAILSLLALTAVGCNGGGGASSGGSAPAAASQGAAAGGGKKVAIISPAKTSEFHQQLAKGAVQQAKDFGWPDAIDAAPTKESDYTGQVALAQDVIEQRPDAISICGINPDALNTIVSKANAARIPIFVHNQISPVNGDVVAYIGYDEHEGGQKCGVEAAELLKQKNGDYKGTVAILDGEPGAHTNDRAGGFKEALAKYPNIKVVDEQNGHWLREPSSSTTRDWLQRFPNLDLVFGCSDQMAQGASQAAANAGKALLTIGIDGNPSALQAVKAGTLTATLGTQPYKMGTEVVKTMKEYFEGQKPPTIVKTECVIITKDNVGQYL